MKAYFEGMRAGEPMIVDEQGRRISVILRLCPETPEEVAELKKFCRLTESFHFIIDEEYRNNEAHTAPVYAEQRFAITRHHREPIPGTSTGQ